MRYFSKFIFLFLLPVCVYSQTQAPVKEYQPCGGPGHVGSTTCESGLTCHETISGMKSCVKQCEFGLNWKCEAVLKAGYIKANGTFQCKFRFGREFNGLNSNISYTNIDYFRLIAPNPASLQPVFDPIFDGKALQAAVNMDKYVVFSTNFIAHLAKFKANLTECDHSSLSLCRKGANFIRKNWADIINAYGNYASSVTSYLGSAAAAETVWLIEKDFWQYYGDNRQENGPLSGNQSSKLYVDIVDRIRSIIPRSQVSWEIQTSLNGNETVRWWEFYKWVRPHHKIGFIHTSGRKSYPNSEFIENNPKKVSWLSMMMLTSRKTIADTGANSTGHDDVYDNADSINARIQYGMVAITQNNPRDNWSDTIGRIRPSLINPCFTNGTANFFLSPY